MSPLTEGRARLSLVALTGVFAVLVVINYWLLARTARTARRGPDGVALGGERRPGAPEPSGGPALTC
jgi:cytochrome d ubiquinol oxidase subunit I